MNEIFHRVSIRKFTDRPVEKGIIMQILRAGMQALLFLEVMNWYDGIVIDRGWVGYNRFWDIPGVGLPYVQTWPQILKKRGILTVIWIAGAAIAAGLVVLMF